MAQNGSDGHQVAAATDDGHTAPPTTVVASSLTSAGGGSSAAGNVETMDAGAGMGKKNLIPDLNMEEHDSASGIIKDKPRSEEAEAVEVPAADADKGKSVAAAADDGKPSVNSIALERERRKKMKGLFTSLHDLMPHVPQKTDKATLVGEAVQFIKFLEEKAAKLEKEKLKRALGQQAAARGEASNSSSSTLTTMPQTAQGMAALSSSGAPRAAGAGWGGGVPVAAAALAVPAPPVRFRTWAGHNVVLTVANDSAYISVCAPRRANTLTMVVSVLGNHGIEVITAQISSDSDRALFLIFAHLNGTDGSARSTEEVYQRAVTEIMYRLHSNDNN